MKTRNIRLTLEYDGTDFSGWQRQPEAETVQGTLEKRLTHLCGHPVELLVAGRTDAGVHALGQVANFHTTSKLPAPRLGKILNQQLPHAIRVVRIEEIHRNFHATYHALGKLYRYVIRNTPDYTVFDRHTYHHLRLPLDLGRMRRAARALVGRHDFTAFRGTLGKWANPKRTLSKVAVKRKGKEVWLEFTGVSFLHQMVRILSGTLVYAGTGKIQPRDIPAILASKDRKKAGPTLPPNGLFLVKVFYPKTFPPVKKRGSGGEE